MKSLILPFALLFSVVHSVQVLAHDEIKLSGFGTVGISCFSDKEADFIYNTLPDGPGRSRECDAGFDSILGLQSDVALTSYLDIVAQITSQRTSYDNFRPEFSMLNLRWQAGDALTFRLGRVSNPLFLDSDHRQVHFALAGMRPQSEVYGISPIFFLDGADASYRSSQGGWNVGYSIGFYQVDFNLARSNTSIIDTVNVRHDYLLSVLAERGPWLVKVSYGEARVSYITAQTDALFNTLRTISPDAAALADQLDFRDARNQTYAAGMRYDQDNWLLQAELGARTYDKSYQGNRYAGYVMTGYRIGIWMPYAILARSTTEIPTSDSRAGPLSAAITGLYASVRQNQNSFTLGSSREMGKGLILKGQMQWIQPDQGNSGNSLVNRSPNYNLANPPLDRLISINLNFIF